MSARVPRLAAAVAVLVAACGDDERCAPVACPAVACVDPFTLHVTDSTLASIPGASAHGDVPCSSSPFGVVCDADASGVFNVTVSAPGYVSAPVVVTVEAGAPATECTCERCATWQPTSVVLAAQ